MGIRFKVTALILGLSLASFIGFGIFIFNNARVQQINRGLIGDYEDALARESFSMLNDFLNTIQASSGISQNLGETFYRIKDNLSRGELAEKMEAEYHTAFARELDLLGGGAFYEPNAFYPDVYDFHCFVSKDLSGPLTENDVRWAGDTFVWDVDTYEEGWYQAALPKGWNRATPYEPRYNWSELYVDTSVNVLMVSVCIPMYSPQKYIIGVATVDVSLSTLQKMVSSFSLPTPSAQIAGFSIANNATFAISGSDKYDITPYPEESWLASLKELKPGQTLNTTIKAGGKDHTLYAHAHNSGIGLAMLIPDAEKYAVIDAVQWTNYITVFAVVLLMIAIIAFVIYAISRWIVRPVRQTSLILNTFAKGDLTQKITVRGNDEFADMSQNLSQAQEGIKNLIVVIKKEAVKLFDIANDLSGNMKETAAAVNEITSNILNIKSRVMNQSASVTETKAAMEQVVANINNVTSMLMSNSAQVQTLISASAEGGGGLHEVSADIQEIARESEGLLEINSVMENIASQTNLLSMNAAIEAAHAGEAGKGFAVVADEIRKLAENSSEQSKTIGTVLKKIAESIKKITVSTDGVLKKFEAIDTGVKTVSRQEETVRSAVEEQEQGSAQIISESSNLEKITQEITDGVNDMASGADHVNEAVDSVNEMTNKNREGINTLLQEVSRFNIQI